MIRRSRHRTTKTPVELSYSRRLNDFQGWIEPWPAIRRWERLDSLNRANQNYPQKMLRNK
jgi:hypothetical protein